jgi:phage/plasmid-like protein (TIGR03299 family)
MSHGITNQDTMFSVRETPWHGLGTVIADAPTIPEAIALAGLDWKVETAPNYVEISGERVETPSQSIIRVDTLDDGSEARSVLASVGPSFVPLQNADAFDWFAPWLDAGVATLETAGSLWGGTRVWVLARLTGDPIVVSGDDEVERYILLAHAHDGSLAVRAGLTPIRVVCHNTLSAAVGHDPVTRRPTSSPEGIFRLTHREGIRERLGAVADQVAALDRRLQAAGESYRLLAAAPMREGDLVTLVGLVYRQTEQQVRSGRRLAQIEQALEEAPGADLPGSRGTLWGLYNALTYYVTHVAGTSPEHRADGAAFGEGRRTLAAALGVCLALADRTATIELAPTA